MKRRIPALAIAIACLVLPVRAQTVTVTDVQVLPLSPGRMLVEVKSPQPPVYEVTRSQGQPAIFIKDATMAPYLVQPDHTLSAHACIRVTTYPIRVQLGTDGVWLVFQSTRPLELSVVTSDNAFLEEAARQLPVYPQWSKTSATGTAELGKQVTSAQQAFEQNDLPTATADLEVAFLSIPEPPKALYALLGALYLDQEQWTKALCLYGQGAQQYPDVLGLRYSALLYQLHQPDKAIQVLSDMLISVEMPQNVLSQANYMLGTLYLEEKEYDKAIPPLRNASLMFGNNPTVWYNLAIAYEGAHQRQQALDTYRKAAPMAQGNLLDDIQQQITRLEGQQSSTQLPHPARITG